MGAGVVLASHFLLDAATAVAVFFGMTVLFVAAARNIDYEDPLSRVLLLLFLALAIRWGGFSFWAIVYQTQPPEWFRWLTRVPLAITSILAGVYTLRTPGVSFSGLIGKKRRGHGDAHHGIHRPRR